jgi:hypothetical protein
LKASTLIEKIKELAGDSDPEVLVDNADIYSMVRLPAFEDGCGERIIYDGYEEIYEVELFSDGDKIILTPFPLEDILVSNPDIPVTLNIHNNNMLKLYLEKVNLLRDEGHSLNQNYKELLKERDEKK